MKRLAWMALGAVCGVAGGVAAYMRAGILDLDDSPAATIVFVIAAALFCFYLASFAAPACRLVAQIAGANKRLGALLGARGDQASYEPKSLIQAIGCCCLGELASCYVDGLRAGGAGERWRGQEPACAFPLRSVVEDPLMTALYCRFSAAFIALGLIALLMGSAGIIDDGLTSVTAMSELRAMLVSSAAAFAAATFTCLVQPLLTGLCQGELDRFVRLVRRMFAVDDGSHELRQLVEQVASLRRELVGFDSQASATVAPPTRPRSTLTRRTRAGSELKV